MNSISRSLYFILAFFIFSLPSAYAEGSKKAIPAFLEANSRNREIIFTNAKYNRNAKVFYLYYVSSSTYRGIDHETKFLTKISRIIFKKGADLIIHTEFSDSDKEYAERYGGHYDIPKEARSCSVKCPIVNSYKAATKRALFKYKDGQNKRYTPSSLYAVDADGIPLARFLTEGDTIVMADERNDKKTILMEGSFDPKTWVTKAIELSYKQLVEKATQLEAQQSTPGASLDADQADEEEEAIDKKKKKKASKKQKTSYKKFKRLQKHREQEDDVEEDE